MADLLVEDFLGGVIGHAVGDARIEECIAQRPALVIFHPVGEVGGLVEAILLGGLGHQLVLDDILQQHALAIGRRVVGETRADFGRGEFEI